MLSILAATLCGTGCTSKAGPDCQKLRACCEAVKADTANLGASTAMGLCDSYLQSKHTDDNLCRGSILDVKAGITRISKPPPAPCQ